jgi:hypothetical protein
MFDKLSTNNDKLARENRKEEQTLANLATITK